MMVWCKLGENSSRADFKPGYEQISNQVKSIDELARPQTVSRLNRANSDTHDVCNTFDMSIRHTIQ